MGSDALDETDGTGATNNASFNEFAFFSGRRVARRDFQNNVWYYSADHLGTARTIIQAGQSSPCYDADFYPFGGEHIYTDTCDSPYKFTGKERDSESGLDDFGARYYSSSLGRFMIPDWAEWPTAVPYAAFGDPQTLNLYTFVENAPINRIDADGHISEEAACPDPHGCSPTQDTGKKKDPPPPTQQPKQQNNNQGKDTQQGSQDPSKIDKDKIVEYIDEHAQKGSPGKCAAYCRRAFEAGGVDTSGHPIDAKDYGPLLLKNGAVTVSQDGYTAAKGDVAVFAGSDSHPHGHIAVYDGKQWVSDFKQRNMSPYRTSYLSIP